MSTHTQYVIGLDAGTTGITALLLTTQGELVYRTSTELPIQFPRPGWVEQDPQEIFELTLQTLSRLLKEGATPAHDICSLGLTNQRETTLVFDKDSSKALGPAINWQCKRSQDICQTWKDGGLEPQICRETGLRLDPYFSASKLRWLLEHLPKAQDRLKDGRLAFATVDTWLVWNFTQGQSFVTDPTNASRTLLYSIHERAWSPTLSQTLGVPPSVLPTVVPSCGPIGHISAHFLGHVIPIRGIVGDQQSALFAYNGTHEGAGKCTFGTGSFMLVTQGPNRVEPSEGILETLVLDAKAGPIYGHEGSHFMAGAVLHWLRDQLKILDDVSNSADLAHSTHADHDVIMVPAFAGLGSPHWNEQARASLFGMSRQTTQAHVVKAALDAIAFQTFELLAALDKTHAQHTRPLSIDGGVSQNPYFCQFLADILARPIQACEMPDMTALGAAKLAMCNSSFAPHVTYKTYTPALAESERQTRLRRWNRAVAATLAFHTDDTQTSPS